MQDTDETLSTADQSSQAAGHEAARETASGATTESPPVTPDAKSEPDRQGRETSSSSQDAKKTPPKLTEVIKAASDTLGKDIVEEGEEQRGSSAAGTEAGKGKPNGAAAAKDETATATADSTALDAHFHTRDEWKKAVEIGGDKIKPILRQIFSREAQLSERLQKAEPEAKSLAKIRAFTGNNETGFKNLNTLLETFTQDPGAALPMLEKLVEDAKQRAGLVLQSDDLKREAEKISQQLKDNVIDEETANAQKARLVEIEKARAGKRAAETRLQQTNESQQQRQAREAQQQTVNALNTWEESVRARYPDLGALTDLNDPNHGESVMDQVFDLLASKVSIKPPATTAEYTALAQQCLETVQKRIGKLLPAGRTMRPMTSQSSSATAKVKPRNFQEAEQQARKSLFGTG